MEKMPTADDAWLVWLDLPTPRLNPVQLNTDKLARLLGTTLDAIDRALPVTRTQDGDVLLFLQDLATLQGLVPEFNGLREFAAKQRIRGFCVATLNTLSDSIHVQSRFFAPAAGVPEDPVTGSVHGPLATYLVVNELVPFYRDTAAVHCVQAEADGRAGVVRAMVTRHPGQGYSVRIAGQCVTTMKGKLAV
jgi:PhzF family phenazine biosynthesis protein